MIFWKSNPYSYFAFARRVFNVFRKFFLFSPKKKILIESSNISSEKPEEQAPKKIEVFCRQAFFSSISRHKKRFSGFSHELCYRNLKETLDFGAANLTFFFDAAKGPLSEHFLKDEKNVIQIHEGTEAGSFLRLLEHVSKLDLHPETILYFLEDDYLHRPGWLSLLSEGLEIADYVTLYDHRDKYFRYPKLSSQIFASRSAHWRSTPSTTNTFALRFKTLLRDLAIHRKFSQKREITADHEKFCYLQARGIILISSIPGWSTHSEPEFASPCIDWEKYLTRN